jgi:general secretion pathway protein B
MSIILEALKKSEQSRQLGETPTLGTPVEGASAPDGPSHSMVPVLMIVLSAIVMAWFGWQQFTMPEPVDTTAEPAMVSSKETPAPVISNAGESSPRTMTENYRAPAEPPAETQPMAEGSDAEETQELQQSVEQFVAEQDSEPEPATVGSDIASDAEDAMEQLAQERAPQETSADPGLKPHIAEPISYWELPQGVRNSLPEIRITVLVYADEPGDRFLLSNGQRLVEKDKLDGGVVLDEIRRDGAVFKYRNYRFLVKG